MSVARARAAVLAAALALVAVGCGGSTASPASPPSWEIDEAAPSSAGAPAPSAVPGADTTANAPADKAPENESAVRKLAPGSVPAPRAEQPSWGPLNAPVLIQVFSDFECPYCQKTPPLIGELEREFGAKIRVVWRALPLPNHPLARESATAALEAHAQRGDATFWRVHDRLFAEAADGLTQREIDSVLQSEGVDVTRYREALKSGARDAAIASDVAAADATAVEGTPAFLINDYYLYGSQPFEVLRAVVEQALEERD